MLWRIYKLNGVYTDVRCNYKKKDMTNYNNNVDEPPEYGELTFSFELEPVSLQSSTTKREFVKSEIRKVTKSLNYLLSGDVKIDIQWLVYEQERYENPDSPDMDNIIKPILDGLTGPDGVLIDDCQVQTVSSHWIDWNKKEHQINISIRYCPDDYVSKQNLAFVNIGNNLYMPFNTNLNCNAREILIKHYEKGMKMRDKVLKETGSYYQAKMYMSIQRIFHKSRIFGKYTCIELADFKKEIKLEKQTIKSQTK